MNIFTSGLIMPQTGNRLSNLEYQDVIIANTKTLINLIYYIKSDIKDYHKSLTFLPFAFILEYVIIHFKPSTQLVVIFNTTGQMMINGFS
jgi:hypothetical protein